VGLRADLAFHLNERRCARIGSGLDVMRHLGRGFLGARAFRNCLTIAALRARPRCCLEEAKGARADADIRNLATLRKMRRPGECCSLNEQRAHA